MPNETITPDGSQTRSAPAHVVKVRRKWADEWTVQPYLFASFCKFVAAPALDEATLEYRYGIAFQAGDDQYREYAPLDLDRWYVRIEIEQPAPAGAEEGATGTPIVWHGVVADTFDDRHGSTPHADGRTLRSGIQTFQCAGLGLLLDRKTLTQSRVFDPADAEKTINRGIGWNLGRGTADETRRAPNMSATGSAAGLSLFHPSLADAATTSGGAHYWTSSQILDYLLHYHGPAGVTFKLDKTNGQVDHLDTTEPPCQADGRSLREIIGELIHRRRLATYRIDVDQETNQVRIVPFTFNDEDIVLPDGTIIAANPLTKSLNFDAAVDVRSGSRRNHASRYDQVIARGARRGAVCNLANPEGTLEADWPDADETTYNDAAKSLAGYPADHDERRARNTAFRATDALSRVYSYLRIPASWDGNVKNGENGGTSVFAFPEIDEAGDISSSFTAQYWTAGLRCERLLPFVQGTDYSGGKIADGSAASALDAATDPEFRPLALFIKDKFNRWRAGELLRDDTAAKGYGFNVAARPQDAGFGVVLAVQGAPQHVLAIDEFTAADTSDNVPAELNWKAFIVTAYIQGDEHVTASYPPASGLPDRDLWTLVIPVPDAHLDFVPYQTIVGTSDGELQRTEAPGFVRDDRPRLQAIAQLAHAWYCTDRRALDLSYKQIRKLVQVGDLITQIGPDDNPEAIRSVVTSVTYDLDAGRTSFATEFLDLDPSLFARR